MRKIGKWAVLLVVVFFAAQTCVSFALRTDRMRGYLITRLERAFGRPVQVQSFSAEIFPWPRLEMDGVTVGEDPGFGNEYFLRAENMQASLRWMGLVRGQFEFGTMSLTRPSLILVRNGRGQWNLEGWLPPAESKTVAGSTSSKPPIAFSPSNYVEKIEFDDGRINFKTGDEKRTFAFTEVSGSVEQQGPGRWQLRLQAKPWRSGVVLQSAGVLYVRGDVAGTSARLQPAQLQVHWDRVSLADLFRLATGNDLGVRGEFALDGTASVGASPGKWKYEVEARATQVHRWDLTERSDNPRVSLRAKGEWDLRESEAVAEEIQVDLPQSNVRGAGKFETVQSFPWSARIESAAVNAEDVLAWYRAFQPDVADGLAVEQFFSGAGAVHGWPLKWDEAHLESDGGALRVPGVAEPLRVAVVHGELAGKSFVLRPVRVSLDAVKAEVAAAEKSDKVLSSRENRNSAELKLICPATFKNGELQVEGHLDQPEIFFKTAAAFGKTLNRGWELSGPASGLMGWDWDAGLFRNGVWSGGINFTKAELQVAGLNLPILLEDARLEWKAGQRSATIRSAEAFGATWSGTIAETHAATATDAVGDAGGGIQPRWRFRLHADHLDAAELDRWAGPRARPNWLQRLLPALLGDSNSGAKPSELLRRVSAEGELSADTVSVEKIKLSKAHAKVSMQDLHLSVRDAEAEWAGGTVRGTLRAVFSVSPRYEISAEVQRVDLAQLPLSPGWAERWSGLASGQIQLTAEGVGREELLKQVAGRGNIQLKNVDFHGWDVAGSLESGATRAGVSHWSSGEGTFEIADRAAHFAGIELDEIRTKTVLAGSIGFGPGVALTFSSPREGAADARVMKVSGASEEPRVVIENVSTALKRPVAREERRRE